MTFSCLTFKSTPARTKFILTCRTIELSPSKDQVLMIDSAIQLTAISIVKLDYYNRMKHAEQPQNLRVRS